MDQEQGGFSISEDFHATTSRDTDLRCRKYTSRAPNDGLATIALDFHRTL